MKIRSFLCFTVLTACGSSLGTLGVIDDDAGSDAGRASVSDAGGDVAIEDAAPEAEASSTFGSPEGGRPVAIACADAGRPPGVRQDAGGCQADTDCNAGAEGRCGFRRFDDGGSANVCTYQACYVDSTCTGVCGCGVGSKGENLCLSSSNCRVDGDCVAGERCVYSDPIILRATQIDAVVRGNEVGGINYQGDAIGYFCTTPKDECGAPPAYENIAHRCIYNLEVKRWRWGYGP